jgi:PIN domain nuclease of toxin-antitoxin system
MKRGQALLLDTHVVIWMATTPGALAENTNSHDTSGGTSVRESRHSLGDTGEAQELASNSR